MVNAINYATIANRIFLLITFYAYLEITNSSSDMLVKNICSTEKCRRTAMEISKNMDLNVSPCDNFYQFVCGKFINDTKLSDDYSLVSVTDKMEDSIPSLIESYLDKNSFEKKNKPYEKAFILYELCKNRDAVEGQEVTNLQQLIEEIGDWPIVAGEQWIEQRWENVTGRLSQFSVDAGIFFNVQITTGTSRADFGIMLSAKRFLKLSRKSWNRLFSIAIKMGANITKIDRALTVNSISAFDHLNHLSRKNDHYSYLTIHEMIARWPIIDWMTYFTGFFSVSSMITIDKNQRVYANLVYIDDIVSFVKKTTKSAIMNYVVAHFIEGYFMFLRVNFPSELHMESSQKTLELSSANRKKDCAKFTTRQLPEMVDAIFYVNHVDDQLQNKVNHMTSSLKNKMDKLLKQANWLDNQTLQHFIEKLSNLTIEIGYQDALKNNEYIEKYNDFNLDERSFVHSILSISRFMKINQLRNSLDGVSSAKASSEVMNTFVAMPMISANANYSPILNKIVILPGLLQDPLINDKLPEYLNYGGIGYSLAHELAHGFPSIKEISMFMTKADDSSDKLLDKISCSIDQYHNYIIKEFNKTVNGDKTVLENIADNIGVKLAHLIYKDWMERNTHVQLLVNLNYNPMQMFWISLAKNQCTKYNSKYLDEIQRNDVHSLSEFRTNGPLSNNPEFSAAFNCPLGSPMNPVNKCILW